MKKTVPDFSMKVVTFGIVGDDHGYAVENPRFEIQAGRLFLVGTVPPGGSTRDWSEGALIGVAWDKVTDYLVFDSAKDYWKRLKICHRRKGEG